MRLPVFLLCLLSILPVAHAQSARPAGRLIEVQGIPDADLAPYPGVRAALEKGDLAGALQALGKLESAHENDPSYYDLTGVIALKAGNYAAAATAFERVVLMQPDNAGAWLDLAVASTEAGNYAAANAYFDHIEANFAPPPTLRNLISRFRARISAPVARPVKPFRLSVEALVGRDTNANSGLGVSSIPLTIDGTRVDLPLDADYTARPDSFGQFGLTATYKKPMGADLLELTANARQRSFRSEHDFNTFDLSAGAGLVTSTAWGDVSYWLNGAELTLGQDKLVRIARSAIQLERPVTTSCRLTGGVEAEWRRYVTLTNLSANLTWAMGSVGCESRAAGLPYQFTLLGRIGVDQPTGNRAGGHSRVSEVIAQLSLALPYGAYADLSQAYTRNRDEVGYSVLLENNARRKTLRHRTRLAITLPLRPDLDALFILDNGKTRSNLKLFDQTGRVFSVGLRAQF